MTEIQFPPLNCPSASSVCLFVCLSRRALKCFALSALGLSEGSAPSPHKPTSESPSNLPTWNLYFSALKVCTRMSRAEEVFKISSAIHLLSFNINFASPVKLTAVRRIKPFHLQWSHEFGTDTLGLRKKKLFSCGFGVCFVKECIMRKEFWLRFLH